MYHLCFCKEPPCHVPILFAMYVPSPTSPSPSIQTNCEALNVPVFLQWLEDVRTTSIIDAEAGTIDWSIGAPTIFLCIIVQQYHQCAFGIVSISAVLEVSVFDGVWLWGYNLIARTTQVQNTICDKNTYSARLPDQNKNRRKALATRARGLACAAKC